MALIANASIIIEAGEASGSLHQGWEALRLGRPLLIWKTLFENPELSWPRKMIDYGALVLKKPGDVLNNLPSSGQVIPGPQVLTMLLPQLEFGSLLSYSPRGNTTLSATRK